MPTIKRGKKPVSKENVAAAQDDALARYRLKRTFSATPEPAAPAPSKRQRSKKGAAATFVVQKHWARRLHYDFRLECNGVLLSWAVPKGPCYDPAIKRMAVRVEDHPLDYGTFEGAIPSGNYGAGEVIVWDRGTWKPIGDPQTGITEGKLGFELHGEKLSGQWELVRTRARTAKQDAWILFKKRDAWARPLADYDVTIALPDSVIDKTQVPADWKDALTCPLPAHIAPQLATRATSLPTGEKWRAETKFDGYRLLARVDQGKIKLLTRNGENWAHRFPVIVRALTDLKLRAAWLDGEIVALVDGKPDFSALQAALDDSRDADLVYFVFDLMYLDTQDLRAVPLSKRRERLRTVLAPDLPHVRFSEQFDAPAEALLRAACGLGLEGIVLKDQNAPYRSGRTQSWLKGKCRMRQAFVVCGYSTRATHPVELASLTLGYYENGALLPAGRVGTGWDRKTADAVLKRLSLIKTSTRPFGEHAVKSGRWAKNRSASDEHWVEPTSVAEVTFAEWTSNGQVRQASFQGLRSDKPATSITRDADLTDVTDLTDPPERSASVITHGDRIIDASTGLRKQDLVRYYESVAEWMLPHLRERPVSLVRASHGLEGEMFFQRHALKTRIAEVRQHDPSLWPGHGSLLSIDSPEALFAAAQMNTIEFHTWNSTVDSLMQPDRLIFDLDPGEGLSWAHMKEAALLARTLLSELKLQAWLKTSGGKGLHIVVPLTPALDYAEVRAFTQSLVKHMAAVVPTRFVAKSGPANRKGRVFVDYLRNGVGQTTVAAFSARARPGLGVSVPIAWESLDSLKNAAQWSISNVRDYLSFRGDDPWAGFFKKRQSLKHALAILSKI